MTGSYGPGSGPGNDAAAGLPASAAARVRAGRAGGTWSSGLSTAEFAAIRGVGFAPVGQVMGTTVQQIGWSGFGGCGYSAGFFGGGRSYTRTSAQNPWSGYAPLVKALYNARHLAVSRLLAECSALGGDGVVGVQLTVGPFLQHGTVEFQAMGTAVRAEGTARPRQPFSSHLSGQEFAKLVTAGWIPVALVLGVSIGIRHDDWTVQNQTGRLWAGNVEVAGWTELVQRARHEARLHLWDDVGRSGADGCVLSEMDLVIREQECPNVDKQRDHIAEANMLGTAIARFRSRPVTPAGSLAVLSLDPQRRARARAGRPGLPILAGRWRY